MTHVDDGDLIRLMDGEVEPEERARLEAHITNCAACETRERQLTSYVVTVRESLQAVGGGARSRRRWPAWQLKAAVVLLALTGASLAAQPVRAWMFAQGRRVWAAVFPAAATRPQPDPSPTTIAFRPSLGVFTIQVAQNQEVGTLTVSLVSGDSARVRATAPQVPRLYLLTDGFRIDNNSSARDSYDVAVPVRMSRVKVVIGTEPPLWLDGREGLTRWEIVLDRGRSRLVRSFH